MADKFPYMELLFVPPNMTSVCQPADTGLQKPLKDGIKAEFHRWLVDNWNNNPDSTRIPLGMRVVKGPSLSWIFKSWQSLADRPEMVQAAWAAAGLGSLDNEDIQESVRKEGVRRYLQEVASVAEREVTLEVAMDADDLEPEDVLQAEDAARSIETSENGAQERQRCMMRLAREELQKQLTILSERRGGKKTGRRFVRKRGRGVTFEPNSEETLPAVPEAHEREGGGPSETPGAGPSRPLAIWRRGRWTKHCAGDPGVHL